MKESDDGEVETGNHITNNGGKGGEEEPDEEQKENEKILEDQSRRT